MIHEWIASKWCLAHSSASARIDLTSLSSFKLLPSYLIVLCGSILAQNLVSIPMVCAAHATSVIGFILQLGETTCSRRIF